MLVYANSMLASERRATNITYGIACKPKARKSLSRAIQVRSFNLSKTAKLVQSVKLNDLSEKLYPPTVASTGVPIEVAVVFASDWLSSTRSDSFYGFHWISAVLTGSSKVFIDELPNNCGEACALASSLDSKEAVLFGFK